MSRVCNLCSLYYHRHGIQSPFLILLLLQIKHHMVIMIYFSPLVVPPSLVLYLELAALALQFNNFTVLLLTRYIKQMIKVLIDGEYENIDVRNTLIVSLSVLSTSTTVEFTKLLQLCIILHSTVSIMISKSSDMNSSMNSSNLSSIMQCFLVNPHACCVSRRSQCTQKMALMHLSPLPGPILVYTLTVM
jgi:hypothetical protein